MVKSVLAVVVVAGALALAGCGGSSNSNKSEGAATSTPTETATATSAPSGSGGGGKTVMIGAVSSGAPQFTKRVLTASSGTDTFKFSNPSGVPHAFAIIGHGVKESTKVVTSGSASLRVKLKPGKYVFYCPVDAHKAAGMVGVLSVK
jgi:plastocyanin